jgi:HAMP domain-containing protein
MARVSGLRDADGTVVGATVTLASLDQRLAPFRRIENALVWVGLLAIAAAFALSYALSRRIVRPVRELVGAAEAARAGDYDRAISVEGSDEIGRLASAFDALLAELRERRDMEAYVASLSRNLPDGGRDGRTGGLEGSMMKPGTLFGGRFEVLALLGSGGMGEVYKARDRELDDVVALKTLRREIWSDSDALERLKSELRLARRITHRNVLRTHDFGELEGVPFISMEYVRGLTLRELLDQAGRLPHAAGLRVTRQLCAGLAAAHGIGVVHRDIKPENVILDATGDAKLMDFGIAHPARRGPVPRVEVDALLGTPRYMAPEQIQGREPDARADVYACGVVLYEVFVGALPYEAPDLESLHYQQLNENPPAPRTRQPDVPEPIERIILRCLAREPEERYANAAGLLEDLQGTAR